MPPLQARHWPSGQPAARGVISRILPALPHPARPCGNLASNSFLSRQNKSGNWLAGQFSPVPFSNRPLATLLPRALTLVKGGRMWYSTDLCEDARPFAPYMSYGSRATQAKPDALPSCSEKLPETASFFAGDRRFVSACARRFSHENLFRTPGRATYRCAKRRCICFVHRTNREEPSL
jgi:hypothetical protein